MGEHFAWHWLTIHPSLFGFLEYEIGELDESQGLFARVMESLGLERIAAEGLFGDFVSKVTAGRIVLQRSIDSTEIDARKRAATKVEKSLAESDAAFRTQVGANADDYNALLLQCERDRSVNLALLPRLCDWGCKRNSKGKVRCWRGHKLHIAVADGDFPIAACLTSASDHDSKAAIPLMQLADEAALSLYYLGDAAYDAKKIRSYSEAHGHVPIIDANPRRGGKPDGRDARTVRIPPKVVLHLMLGHLVITVEQPAHMLR